MAKKKKASASKKAAPKKKASAKKSAKRPTKVIDVPLKTVYYKQGELIDGFEILEEASAGTFKFWARVSMSVITPTKPI